MIVRIVNYHDPINGIYFTTFKHFLPPDILTWPGELG